MDTADKKVSKDTLEKISSEYDVVNSPSLRLLWKVRGNEYNIFKSYVASTLSVMEIGLGDGMFTSFLAEEFESVIAVDASENTIASVKRKLAGRDNITYLVSYIEQLQLKTPVANIVLSHLLEHLPDPAGSLAKMNDLLSPGGIIYVSVPNALSLHRQVAVHMGLLKTCNALNDMDRQLGHLRVYTPQLLQEHVAASGLRIISSGGSMLKPLSNAQIAQQWTDEMIDGFIKAGEQYPELCGDIYVVAGKR